VVEQRYQAVLAVIADGRTVAEVAGQWSVSRQPSPWLDKTPCHMETCDKSPREEEPCTRI
jgi:hypothetical protein